MGDVIDCKSIANSIQEEVRREIKNIISDTCITPILAILTDKNCKESAAYLRSRERIAESLGVSILTFDYTNNKKILNQLIDMLNGYENVLGIMLDKPYPFDNCTYGGYKQLVNRISKAKDIECQRNNKQTGILPCTSQAILEVLKRNTADLESKRICLVGRSENITKPLIDVLLKSDATLTICHSKTPNIHRILCESDIVISAVGKENFNITKDYIKKGALLIDASYKVDDSGKASGDFDKNCIEVCSAMTSVPGGIGLITPIMAFKNMVTLLKISE